MNGLSLRIEVLTTFDQLLAYRAVWRELEQRCGTDLPFQTWEWAVAWWSKLHEDSWGVRDSLRICVVSAEDGQLVAVAPFMLTERPSLGPVRLRCIQLLGADPNITEVRSILCLPERAADAYAAIKEYLLEHDREWDWIVWDVPDGDIATTVAAETRTIHAKPAFVVTLKPTWEEFKQGLKRNIKESLRKCYNSLRRDNLSFRLEVVDHPREIESALQDFYVLHGARATLDSNIAHPNVFSTARSREFLLDVCRRLALRGACKVFRLHVNDHLVATRIAFAMADTLYMYYSGWDPEYGRYSVMTTLLAEAMQWAISQKFQYVHLSTGSDPSKTRWGAEERRYLSTIRFGSGWAPARRYKAYKQLGRVVSSSAGRVLTPGFLMRRSQEGPKMRATSSTRIPWHWVVLAPAMLVVLDLMDGKADGVIKLTSKFVA